MTKQELRDIAEAFEHLRALPRRHTQEMLNAQYDLNKKIRDCDHILPDGHSAVSEHSCNICGRRIEPPT